MRNKNLTVSLFIILIISLFQGSYVEAVEVEALQPLEPLEDISEDIINEVDSEVLEELDNTPAKKIEDSNDIYEDYNDGNDNYYPETSNYDGFYDNIDDAIDGFIDEKEYEIDEDITIPVYEETDYSNFVFEGDETGKNVNKSSISFDFFDAGGKSYNSPNKQSYETYEYTEECPEGDCGVGDKSSMKVMKSSKKGMKTIQYTFDLEGEYPNYIDTGIGVDEDENVSVDGLVEFLTQIAIREDGKVVEDNDKVLLLLNGNIIIAKEGLTSVRDIEDMFHDHPIKVSVQKTRSGGRFDLVEKLERTGVLPVEIDGKEIKLIAKPALSDSKVLFPIKSIGEGLGAEINWDKTKREATVTKDDKKLVFKSKSDIVLVNGKEFKISAPTKIREDEMRLLSIINILVNELDGDMTYDTQKGVLVIETIEGIERANDW